MQFAAAALQGTLFAYDRVCDYILPPHLEGKVQPGCRISVPYGKKEARRIAFVLSVSNSCPQGNAASLLSLEDGEPVLSAEQTALGQYLAETCFCTVYDMLDAMLPAAMKLKPQIVWQILPPEDAAPETFLLPEERVILEALRRTRSGFAEEAVLLKRVNRPNGQAVLGMLEEKGFVCRQNAVRPAAKGREREAQEEAVLHIALSADRLEDTVFTPKQQAALEVIRSDGAATAQEICTLAGVSMAIVKSLLQKGILEAVPRCVPAKAVTMEAESLSPAQLAVYTAILEKMREARPKPVLLYGVTGSGKTRIYTALAAEVLKAGKSVLILVPEIILTPQTAGAFTDRFGAGTEVFHSGLSMAKRRDAWERVRCGESKVVVGTRSAVFAPLQDIGLIVMDEEHDPSYKSGNPPRYHARDAARFRAAKHGALLLMASATPSVESYAKAEKGIYTLLSLTERYGGIPLPQAETVDMLAAPLSSAPMFSVRLLEALQETVQSGKQAMLLLNRRGYRTFVQCPSCREALTCPRCSISLTYHLAENRLRCHLCGYSRDMDRECPLCGKPGLRLSGAGTQSAEEELRRLLPAARIGRLDADAAGKSGCREELLAAFRKRDIDILIGTQMIAKGLDFPAVALVGVLNADQSLFHDDFRSGERMFSLLAQVAGRAGRAGEQGYAIIQTNNPYNEILRMAARQDYPAFFQTEIEIRKLLTYPPYCSLCTLSVCSNDDSKADGAIRFLLLKLKELLKTESYAAQKVMILGPAPASIPKQGGKFYKQLVLKCRTGKVFTAMLRELLAAFYANAAFRQVTAFADIE
ncbi:MAG: primosomal protein N' [Oscillospiraceae bacterium]|jgi:primosomal protein N' (replication factor Y)|nr:primosomal protein N' [Oscillospiraceae bacterium]